MSNTTTVRYEYHESQAPLFLKATWVRIETSDLAGIIVERLTPVEKPEIAPVVKPERSTAAGGQLAFRF